MQSINFDYVANSETVKKVKVCVGDLTLDL